MKTDSSRIIYNDVRGRSTRIYDTDNLSGELKCKLDLLSKCFSEIKSKRAPSPNPSVSSRRSKYSQENHSSGVR